MLLDRTTAPAQSPKTLPTDSAPKYSIIGEMSTPYKMASYKQNTTPTPTNRLATKKHLPYWFMVSVTNVAAFAPYFYTGLLFALPPNNLSMSCLLKAKRAMMRTVDRAGNRFVALVALNFTFLLALSRCFKIR